MTYYNFINKTKKYLKSVRLIKNYVSIDMNFSRSWVIPKELVNKLGDKVQLIKNSSEENIISLSFVLPLDDETLLHITEEVIDGIIKYNIEKEEKDNLFKDKVKELKSIFEKQKLSELKYLKFDVDINNKIETIDIEDERQDFTTDVEGDGDTKKTETEQQIQHH